MQTIILDPKVTADDPADIQLIRRTKMLDENGVEFYIPTPIARLSKADMEDLIAKFQPVIEAKAVEMAKNTIKEVK